VAGNTVTLDLPVRAPELTLRLPDAAARAVTVDGAPLRQVGARAAFASGTFYVEDGATLLAFDPAARQVRVEVTL